MGDWMGVGGCICMHSSWSWLANQSLHVQSKEASGIIVNLKFIISGWSMLHRWHSICIASQWAYHHVCVTFSRMYICTSLRKLAKKMLCYIQRKHFSIGLVYVLAQRTCTRLQETLWLEETFFVLYKIASICLYPVVSRRFNFVFFSVRNHMYITKKTSFTGDTMILLGNNSMKSWSKSTSKIHLQMSVRCFFVT